jgi:hypothetical protein
MCTICSLQPLLYGILLRKRLFMNAFIIIFTDTNLNATKLQYVF